MFSCKWRIVDIKVIENNNLSLPEELARCTVVTSTFFKVQKNDADKLGVGG
jgi:hypothetical protein